MTNVVTKPLPHKVGNAAIASGELKTIVMQFMENFLSVGGQLSTVQEAVRELQRRPATAQSSDIADIETYVSRAESAATTATGAKDAAVSAKNDAVSAKNDATSAKTDALSAKNDAVSAKNDAVSAKNDAVSASGTATGAASDAQGYASSALSAATRAETAAASVEWSVEFMFCGVQLESRASRRFFLSDIVPDSTKDYIVEIVFNNTEGSNARTCEVTIEDVANPVQVYVTQNTDNGGTAPKNTTGSMKVAGSKYFIVANKSVYVDVLVKIRTAREGE